MASFLIRGTEDVSCVTTVLVAGSDIETCPVTKNPSATREIFGTAALT
jgi:hypothetical protein